MPAPTTVLSGVTVGPSYDWSILAGTSTSPTASGCNLKMVGSTVTGNRLGLWAAGCGVGVGASSVAVAIGDGTKAGGNSFLNLQTGTATGVAVLQYDCVSPLTIDYATFDGSDAGASFLNHSGPAGGDANLTQPNLLQIRNSTFQNLLAGGLLVYNGAVIDQLIGNTFTKISAPSGGAAKNAPAIWLASNNAQIVKARNNVVVGNDIGLLIDGNALSSTGRPTLDFGNANDPGNNTLACNSSLAATGGDVMVNVGSSATLPINLQGNKWDHAPPTAATTQSNGLDLFYSSTSYVNTANATAAGVTCSAGRVP